MWHFQKLCVAPRSKAENCNNRATHATIQHKRRWFCWSSRSGNQKKRPKAPLPLLERQSPMLVAVVITEQATINLPTSPLVSPLSLPWPTLPTSLSWMIATAASYLVPFLSLLPPVPVRVPKGNIKHSKRGDWTQFNDGALN